MTKTTTQPFDVAWIAAERAAVLAKIAAYEFPPAPPCAGWSLGCDTGFLKRLRSHWLESFDWQRAIDRLNLYPQFTATIDGLDIHYVHVRGEAPARCPLLLLHGWPSSHFEFWNIIDRLAFPSRHGGEAAEACDLIIPSLPGYGFSGKPPTIIGPRAIAQLMNRLMIDIVCAPRYLAHGGDWGAVIASWLGIDHPDHAVAIHLSMIALPQRTELNLREETEWLAGSAAAQRQFGAYSHLQSSRPQSLAWLAANNPLGQAAWIIERFHDWSDLRHRCFEEAFDLDWLITNVLIYIMTGSFRTAAYLYRGLALESGAGSVATVSEGIRCETPTAFTRYLGDRRVVAPPRQRAEHAYNIVRWVDAPRGGHFPAHEVPESFADDLRDWRRAFWRD